VTAVPTAFALRHVHFEDLGTFEPVLSRAGYKTRYIGLGMDDVSALDPLEPDLVIVLGGPIGVYETVTYPFLRDELQLLQTRLAPGRPTLGICLGAQLIAHALGAAVAPTGNKEIGFSPVTLTPSGETSPLRHLRDVSVLHWHGDAFAIPDGADHLAATSVCAAQAFSKGPNILGVQFHPEVDAEHGFERWLIGHAVELSAAKIDPRALRANAERVHAPLRAAGQAMFSEWLEALVR
jgi:GMP synthase (glutamine-hydrolysing)